MVSLKHLFVEIGVEDELDLTGLDDIEIDNYLLSREEVEVKTNKCFNETIS